MKEVCIFDFFRYRKSDLENFNILGLKDKIVQRFWLGAEFDGSGNIVSSTGDAMSALSGPADNPFMKKRKCNENCNCAQLNEDKSKPDIIFEYRFRACDSGNHGAFLCVPKKKRRRKRSIIEHLIYKIEDDFTRNHQSRLNHSNLSTGKDFNINITNEKKLEKRETKENTKNKEEKVNKDVQDLLDLASSWKEIFHSMLDRAVKDSKGE